MSKIFFLVKDKFLRSPKIMTIRVQFNHRLGNRNHIEHIIFYLKITKGDQFNILSLLNRSNS